MGELSWCEYDFCVRIFFSLRSLMLWIDKSIGERQGELLERG